MYHCPLAIYMYKIVSSLMFSSLKPLEQFKHISHGVTCRKGFDNLLNGSVPVMKAAAMSIYSKTNKNLLLLNQESFENESWCIALMTQDLPTLFK